MIYFLKDFLRFDKYVLSYFMIFVIIILFYRTAYYTLLDIDVVSTSIICTDMTNGCYVGFHLFYMEMRLTPTRYERAHLLCHCRMRVGTWFY